ncbi:MAG TPA: porin family protein [Sulfurimonas sp.]|nr:porin family protein [Sulfurimonas sp.]HIM75266.1 porin family protein [Campylobacterales bacterium]
MKKIILFALLTTSLFAEAKIYMGLGYSLYDESYSYSASDLPSTSDNAYRLKFGYGIREAYAVEFAFDYIEHASYDITPETGKAKYAFNIALMKAFDWGIYINPFVKVGFGAGMIDTGGTSNPSLTYASFDAATGFFIPINSSSDFEIAYEYKNLSYEQRRQNPGETNEEYQMYKSIPSNSSHVNNIYFGYNIRF